MTLCEKDRCTEIRQKKTNNPGSSSETAAQCDKSVLAKYMQRKSAFGYNPFRKESGLDFLVFKICLMELVYPVILLNIMLVVRFLNYHDLHNIMTKIMKRHLSLENVIACPPAADCDIAPKTV